MWSLDGTTVQMTIKSWACRNMFHCNLGGFGVFWVYLGFCFLGLFLRFEGFFPICKILLEFVPYKYMYPRLSLSEKSIYIPIYFYTCEISKSTCSCPAAAVPLGTSALSCPRPHWGLSTSTLLATQHVSFPFFPFFLGMKGRDLQPSTLASGTVIKED